ncbi:MAG TPA: protease pro-enzyme activation domain-containing protein, partial [Acidimicrobiia bacterium]|nr:protease pro-enzyme activation domain-containing protein [Acidimicrobiia bacterium]
MKRPFASALVALAGLAIGTVPAFATEPSSTVRLAAAVSRVPAGAARLGALPSNQQLTIRVVLQPSHTAELATLLHDLYDPASPRYEKWLTPDKFNREFGPDPAEISTVTTWLRSRGLTETTTQGMTVRVVADARDVARAFSVSFARYRLASGTTGYTENSAPLVPASMAAGIAAILGLSDTVRFDPALDVTPHQRLARLVAHGVAAANIAEPHVSTCAAARQLAGTSYWTPRQVGNLYHVNDLVAAGLTGKGKTIALLELAQSRPADTNVYLSCFGLHNTVQVERVDGGAGSDPTGTLEAEIDAQEAATQAPDATIVSYEAPNTAAGEYDAYSRIVNENRAQVVSTSWGECEAVLESEPAFRGAPVIDAMHTLFQQAAAQGQSIFAATGDTGSEDCYHAATPNESLQVDHPADDPFVTGVGGTTLLLAGFEPVWNDCEGAVGDSCAASGLHAGGGGLSNHYQRPNWQPLASNAPCTTCREVPDISANAGVGETFFDSSSNFGSNPSMNGWTAVGGTSIAAPLVAGMATDIAQGCAGGRLGDFAQKLDALAATKVYSSAVSDVTQGFNWNTFQPQTPGSIDLTRTHAGVYHTATGFDLASGLGSPIASGLACPQVTSIAPNHGTAGIHVTLHGVGLERATIQFGTKTATVLSRDPTTAVVIVPNGSGTVAVSGKDHLGAGAHAASFSYPGSDTGAYRTAAADGQIFDFGGAPAYGAPAPGSLRAPVVGMAVDRATGGYWIAAADGNVYGFNAPFYGSAGNLPLNQPIVGIAATKTGDGYWLVARDGGIFAFGHAHFSGSTGGMHLNQPIVGMAADAAT